MFNVEASSRVLSFTTLSLLQEAGWKPKESDWARPRKYAQYVRKLNWLEDLYTTYISDNIWICTAQYLGTPILPCVKTVWMGQPVNSTGNHCMAACEHLDILFGGPSLENFTFSHRDYFFVTDDDHQAKVLSDLSSVIKSSRHIRTLDLDFGGRSFEWSKIISELSHLQSVCTRSFALHPDTMIHLATLPSLQELELWNYPGSFTHVVKFRTEHPQAPLFPRMQKMAWNGVHLSDLHDQLHLIVPLYPSGIQLNFDGILTIERDLSALTCLLSDFTHTNMSHTLTWLYIHQQYYDDNSTPLTRAELELEQNWVAIERIAPITSCTSLQSLYIAIELPFNIDNKDLLDFMSSFPQLRFLGLGFIDGLSIKTTKDVSLDGLLAASKRCPSLLAVAVVTRINDGDPGYYDHNIPLFYYDNNGVVNLAKSRGDWKLSLRQPTVYASFFPNLHAGMNCDHELYSDPFISQMNIERQALVNAAVKGDP